MKSGFYTVVFTFNVRAGLVMKRIVAIFLCLILVTPILVFAQTVKERIDLDFVDGLRKRGDIDLALDYLKIIEKMASPELKVNIPLEIARTQLSKAIAEPDKTRRQKLYLGVMVEIKKFITANPKSACRQSHDVIPPASNAP